MKNILLSISIILILSSCAKPSEPKCLGLVNKLPKGEYVIWKYGSRHIVKCLNSKGKFYFLNDTNFSVNGIKGYGAHEYHKKTKIIIK